ncbi:integral membrane protein [Phyllosticta capitalensis]|uniref:Integral membrane protein n=2 Tax=Phyllosticta capitalensis TaxID=121624 RepID=A0ABR1YI45_9PEZI
MESSSQSQGSPPAALPGRRHSSATPEIVQASAASDRSPSRQSNPSPSPRRIPARPDLLRPQTIRLRRLPSASIPRLETIQSPVDGQQAQDEEQWQSNRRRSSSEPQRPSFNPADLPQTTRAPMNNMATVPESTVPELPPNPDGQENYEPVEEQRPATANAPPRPPGPGRFRRMSTAALGPFARNRGGGGAPGQMSQLPPELEYDPRIVDLLDVIDPEVSTLTSLTNVQNSLFVPDLGRLLNRSSVYQLSRHPTRSGEAGQGEEKVGLASIPQEPPISRQTTAATAEPLQTAERPQLDRTFSITSALSENRHAVLPHGLSLEGWSEDEKRELDDHVRHMLHSRRSRIKRSLKGFGKYVSTPLGFLVTLYATLITLFGLAWVLFLIGWVYVGNKQLYVINVIDNVLVALFAIVGDGLAPFRVVDTYHMIFIAHYHHLTWKLRKKKHLPKLENKNDLPEQTVNETDVEAGRLEKEELSVLTEKQQKKLEHHEAKFCKSHTFYKPHETETHYAFPVRLLIAVVVLLDFHSIFQIALGACTWGIDYRTRPQALTATILSCSITVNISAGIVISIGDRKSRKKDVIERMFRQELTEEAIKKMEKKQEKQEERMRAIEEDPEGEHDARKGRMSLDVFRKSLDVTRSRKSMDKRRSRRPGSSSSGSGSGEGSFSLKSPVRETPEDTTQESDKDKKKGLLAETSEQPHASSSRSSMPQTGIAGSSSSG